MALKKLFRLRLSRISISSFKGRHLMKIFLLTLALLLIVFVAMAIGYLVQRKSIAGSCGGLGALGIEKACNCDNPCDKRLEREALAEKEARAEKEAAWKENQIV